jgi:hypothetical protein
MHTDAAEKAHLPPTHALMFWYGSLGEAEDALLSGVKARAGLLHGITLTLNRPHELDEADLAAFPTRDVVLALSVPWSLLAEVPADGGDKKAASRSPFLRVLPASTLSAARGSFFGSLADPSAWFEGVLAIPPKNIVRAYRLVEKAGDDMSSMNNSTKSEQEYVKDELYTGQMTSRSVSLSSVQPVQPQKGKPEKGRQAHSFSRSTNSLSQLTLLAERTEAFLRAPKSCAELADIMSQARNTCTARGWELVYHYTRASLAPNILKSGFRMSTQGQGGQWRCLSTLACLSIGYYSSLNSFVSIVGRWWVLLLCSRSVLLLLGIRWV